MKRIKPFNDERENFLNEHRWCIHCLGAYNIIDPETELPITKRSNDHVPSKCLLKPPYPADLPTVKICSICNASFAPHEEYMVSFLGAVSNNDYMAEKSDLVFGSNNKLSDELLGSLKVDNNNARIAVELDQSRIDIVLEKNARGHFFFETQDVILSKPNAINMFPISIFSSAQRKNFEMIKLADLFPEVGTRAFSRTINKTDLSNDWVIVQEDQYRYAIVQNGKEVLVKSVICEEFAIEIYWENAFEF
jgi:hypothetical protein